ncbi:iron ABC transporter permease [Aquitalea magnusonii]|nr:iron ABC transporter permease [Aquitalea magnusonii]
MAIHSLMPGRTTHRQGWLFAAALAVCAVLASPLLVIIWQAAQSDPADFIDMLWRPLVGSLALNTAIIVSATTLLCGVLGLVCAWFAERTRLPWQGLWPLLSVAPMAIPTFISSYAWVSLSDDLQGFPGALLVLGSAYSPLVFLPVSAALRGLDPALEETARTLGLGPWRCFFRLILPQLRPALLGGMLLVALSTLSEFGAFVLLRFRTFTTEIFAEYRAGFDSHGAAQLSIVLLLVAAMLIGLEWRVRRQPSYERRAKGTRRAPPRLELGARKWLVVAGFVLLSCITLLLPLSTLAYWLTQHGDAAVSPVEVSTELIFDASSSSIELGLEGAILTVLLALPLGYLLARASGWLTGLMERLAFLVQGVPGIVIALGLVTVSIRVVPSLYQTQFLLLLAYAILFLPLAIVSVRSALLQAESRQEELARSLGLGSWQTWLRVLLPMAAPGLGAAASLVFLSIVTELTATLLLSPIGTETLATQIWADTSAMAYAAAAPYALVLTLLSMASTWLLMALLGKNAIDRLASDVQPATGDASHV